MILYGYTLSPVTRLLPYGQRVAEIEISGNGRRNGRLRNGRKLNG